MKIMAINGRPVEDFTWEEEYRLNRLPQITLDVTGVNGESKQITLSPALRW